MANPIEDLSVGDRKAVHSLLDQRKESASWMGWVIKRDKTKKDKVIKRLLLVTNNRLLSLKGAGKLARDGHWLDLVEIRSSKPNEVEVFFKQFKLFISSDATDEIIHQIRLMSQNQLPGVPESLRYKLEVSPSSRLRDLPKTDQVPLGGFLNTYKALCDFYPDAKIREDIIWDMENLFIPGNIRDFNLKEFEQPISFAELRALLGALQYNAHFKSLTAKNFSLDKNMVSCMAEMLKFNSSLDEITLSKVGITKEGISTICEALSSNKMIALTSLVLSNNPLEDKGFTAVATFITGLNRGLVKLDLASCGATKVGTSALCNALKRNVHMSSTLSYFDLSHNKLDSDGSSALGAFLASPNQMQELLLVNTIANLDVIAGAMIRGSQSVRRLDVSQNKVTKKESAMLAKYLQASGTLIDLNLSGTGIPIECAKDIISAITGNVYLKDCTLNLSENRLGVPGSRLIASIAEKIVNITHLDLGDNEFGDDGVSIICEGLSYNGNLRFLSLAQNFKNRGKTRGAAVEALTRLIGSDCPLESLNVSGGPKSELRTDILPFLYALGTNDSLKYLDISGNQIGNKGAAALGKALQTNEVLETLKWDGNLTTAQGFYSFNIGLKRNYTLKNLPMPIADISAALKEAETNELILKMQRFILRNQSPTGKFGGNSKQEIASGSQFAFLSSGQREGVHKLMSKIKSTGRKVPESANVLIEEVENQDQIMTSLYIAKDQAQQQFDMLLKQKLLDFVRNCSPLFGKIKAELIDQTADIVRKGMRSLDEQTVRRMQTNLAFGGKDLPEDEFEKILVGAAHSQLSAKANQALHSTVSIATDYLYEKTQERLQDVADELANEVSLETSRLSDGIGGGRSSDEMISKSSPLKSSIKGSSSSTSSLMETAAGSSSKPPPQRPPPKLPTQPTSTKKQATPKVPGKALKSSGGVPHKDSDSPVVVHLESLPKTEPSLDHTTKDRASVKQKRRPPTRKPRPAPPTAFQQEM